MVVVFGSLNADLMFALPALPAPGQTLLAADVALQAGGKGANQAVAAARDGAEVAMIGAVGGDALAEIALTGLRAAHVDLSRVVVTAAPTGCASICTDPRGRNQIAVAPGANRHARAAQMDDALARPGNSLVLQMETDAGEVAALIDRARRAGMRTILNLAPAYALARDVLARVDLLVVNEDEAASLGGWLGSGADATALHRALGIDVVRTLGEHGAEATTAAGPFRIPARAVAVVDTTAAGDCFVGILAGGLDRGLPLAAALHRAGAAATLSCTRRGSQASLPAAFEIDAWLSG